MTAKYPRITIFVLAAAMSTGAPAKGDHENEDAVYTAGLPGDSHSKIPANADAILQEMGVAEID